MASEPKTLQQAVTYFSDRANCLDYVVARRWPNGVTCPTCGSEKVTFLENQSRWQCKNKHPKRQFSCKIGTIFEDSPLGLDRWLVAMWLLVNCKNGISSYEIGRDLGISQKSAWHMLHRIRLAVQSGSFAKLDGEIEVDETFIGGKARNMHKGKRADKIAGRGPEGKAIVAAVLERGGKIHAQVMDSRKKTPLQKLVRDNVKTGSNVYSDALKSYDGLSNDFAHQVIDHAEKYVDGQIHTNGLENFWSLLKRGLKGTYVSTEPFHLFRYIDEQAFRYNNRKDLTDSDRLDLAVRQIVGKRLTWAEVTGKEGAAEC
jgi:transposase-like protein